ncbi:MAG: hypothetical protein EPN50_05070 [Chloroflexota bacterium]|nr:MAG: hypothetical protein EPN50_05070 [Chloroflexota bacterium]
MARGRRRRSPNMPSVGFLRGLLGRSGGSRGSEPTYFDIPPLGYLGVHGTLHHLPELVRIFRPGPEKVIVDVPAILIRDPRNRYDPNAVQVRVQDRLVGYIPAELAPEWSAYLAGVEAKGMTARATLHVWHRHAKYDEHARFYLNLRVEDAPPGRSRDEIRAERVAKRAAERERRAMERAEREEADAAQAEAWRAAGLCPGCGGPVEQSGGRGRPRIYCEVCHARRA